MRGFDYLLHAKGNIVTKGGLFQQGSIITFGSAIPKWVGGWLNTFTFKGFRVFTQVDFKAGYKIMSNSNLNFYREGLSKESLIGRQGGVTFAGVNTDGSANSSKVEAEQFYTQYRGTGIATPFIYDGSFVRWRSLSVGYDLSNILLKLLLKALPFQQLFIMCL